MEKRQFRRAQFAQNFLRSRKLVQRLVRRSGIGPIDTVVEIGPGLGIITAELAATGARVIGIENDRRLLRGLRRRLGRFTNVEVVIEDFLDMPLPKRPYKVFANLPYNITAQTVRKLFFGPDPPIEAWLVLQREPARKYAGLPRETEFSILAKPFFTFEITHRFRRSDFDPVPSVDSVLLHVTGRSKPLLGHDETDTFYRFVHLGFSAWKPHLRLAYKHLIGYKQWKSLARELQFSIDARSTDLSFAQWIGLYERWRDSSVSGRTG